MLSVFRSIGRRLVRSYDWSTLLTMCLLCRDAQMIMEDIKRTISELEQESSLPAVGVELVDNELATLYMNSKKSEVTSWYIPFRFSCVKNQWSFFYCCVDGFHQNLLIFAEWFQGLPPLAETSRLNSQEDTRSSEWIRSGLQHRWRHSLPQITPTAGETFMRSIYWI